jgi:hypothetical protein
MSAHTTNRPAILSLLTAIAASLACGLIVTGPALAAAGEGCPNEQVREESNIDPATGQPYDIGLPECRAYEMVSPLDKQSHSAFEPGLESAVPVSPAGTAVGWTSQGAFAEPENFIVGAGITNPYVSRRTASGWVTRAAAAPVSLISQPGEIDSQPYYTMLSPDLSSEAVCGLHTANTSICAIRQADGPWVSGLENAPVSGENFNGYAMLGASRDLSTEVFHIHEGTHLLPADASAKTCTGCVALYAQTGLGTGEGNLLLVDVDNAGNMIGPEHPTGVGALNGLEDATSYQAVSEDGSRIYFTATPDSTNGFGPSTNVQTVFARIDQTSTVDVSDPSPAECTRCAQEAGEGKPENSEALPAAYQGASANGSKVFFVTNQQLVNADTDHTSDLYEYDFDKPLGHNIVQVSAGGAGDLTPGSGAEVSGGIVAISEDGSHVYFVAHGVLTTLPNALGQAPAPDASNLYAFDSATGETKFVAALSTNDDILTGSHTAPEGQSDGAEDRLAQTTPTGRYLVFDSVAKLIETGPEADTDEAQDVYRYDFDTGSLIRVSISHEQFGENGNAPRHNALIGIRPLQERGGGGNGALPTVNDVNRAITDEGNEIVFMTSEQLQANASAGGVAESCTLSGSGSPRAGCQVYEWHECTAGCADGERGAVTMISDGQESAEPEFAAISATGSDIFFQTYSQLVGQDTDELGDIYDARVDGGFPSPAAEPSCSGESCQGAPSASPTLGAPGTASFTGGGNLTAPPIVFTAPKEPKPKPPKQVAMLAKALMICKKDRSKAKRTTCERRAREQYEGKKSGAKKKPGS